MSQSTATPGEQVDATLRAYLDARGTEEKWLKLSHGRARYLEKAGNGPPLVLLHDLSFGSGADRLLNLIPMLAKRYHVYAFDLLGWGPGARPKFQYSSPVHTVDSVRELMSMLKIERAYLVGNGFGARTALGLTYASPGRVLGVVAAAMHPPSATHTGVSPGTFSPPQTTEQLKSAIVRELDDAPDVDYGELAAWAWRNVSVPDSAESYRHWLEHFTEPYVARQQGLSHQRWSRVKVPILLAWPETDPLAPIELGHETQSFMPSSRLVVCKGSHAFVHQHSTEFAERVFSFFADPA